MADLGADAVVMADLIVNHVSSSSAPFRDWQEKGAESEYAGMFLTKDMVFPGGAASDPKGKSGLTALTAGLLVSGIVTGRLAARTQRYRRYATNGLATYVLGTVLIAAVVGLQALQEQPNSQPTACLHFRFSSDDSSNRDSWH